MKMSELLECLFSCDLNKLRSYFEHVDVNCVLPGTDGCTPLHVVAGIENFKNNENIISFLLDNGANPNARSHENLTPVHIAAMWDNCFQLEKLLQSGGNPWLTDSDNKNSFDMAADNHAYEAFQLLNIFLAEDRFTFKPERKILSETFICDCTDKNNLVASESSVDATFLSAKEYFPLMLSTFGDNSSFLLNVSNCIKKKISKPNESSDSKNVFSSNTSDQSQKYYKKQSLDSTISNQKSCTKNYKNNLNLAYCTSSSATNNETSDFLSCNSSNKGNNPYVETIINMDDSGSVQLVEVNVPGDIYSSNLSINSTATDWKSFKNETNENSCDTPCISYCSSHSKKPVIIPEPFQKYTNSEIYEKLVQMGDDPGPVLDHTRQVYLRRLARLNSGCTKLCNLPSPKYYREVYQFFETPVDRGKRLEEIMEAEFDSNTSQNWREGNHRCSFNYLLLDPRITQNLPSRAANLSNREAFLIFLDALFYVGKGTKGRPYDHLFEAMKAAISGNKKGEKIAHILDIWESGFGVISLHCYHSAKPVEAYTREACIIEAVGLNNLTNIKKGNYYGSASQLTVFKKRLIGTSLLYRAFQIFLITGEKQIRPKDV